MTAAELSGLATMEDPNAGNARSLLVKSIMTADCRADRCDVVVSDDGDSLRESGGAVQSGWNISKYEVCKL